MKIFKNYFFRLNIALVVFFALFYSCTENTKSPKHKSQTRQTESLRLNLTAFRFIPEQIKNCYCVFAADKKKFKQKKYILISDIIVTSFVNINGVLTKFIMMSYDYQNPKTSTAIYKSHGYDMKVEIKHLEKEMNKGKKRGKIIITSKDGRTLVKYFYGECGC